MTENVATATTASATTTDDTQALQQLIDESTSLVYIPAGIWHISSPLLFPFDTVNPYTVSLDPAAVIIATQPMSTMLSLGGGQSLNGDYSGLYTLTGGKLVLNGNAQSGVTVSSKISNLIIRGCSMVLNTKTTGIVSPVRSIVADCQFQGNESGTAVSLSAADSIVTDCQFTSLQNSVTATQPIQVTDCQFLNAGYTCAVTLPWGAVRGCRFQATNSCVAFTGTGGLCTVSGCAFNLSTTDYCATCQSIKAGDTVDLVVSDCDWNTPDGWANGVQYTFTPIQSYTDPGTWNTPATTSITGSRRVTGSYCAMDNLDGLALVSDFWIRGMSDVLVTSTTQTLAADWWTTLGWVTGTGSEMLRLSLGPALLADILFKWDAANGSLQGTTGNLLVNSQNLTWSVAIQTGGKKTFNNADWYPVCLTCSASTSNPETITPMALQVLQQPSGNAMRLYQWGGTWQGTGFGPEVTL